MDKHDYEHKKAQNIKRYLNRILFTIGFVLALVSVYTLVDPEVETYANENKSYQYEEIAPGLKKEQLKQNIDETVKSIDQLITAIDKSEDLKLPSEVKSLKEMKSELKEDRKSLNYANFGEAGLIKNDLDSIEAELLNIQMEVSDAA